MNVWWQMVTSWFLMLAIINFVFVIKLVAMAKLMMAGACLIGGWCAVAISRCAYKKVV